MKPKAIFKKYLARALKTRNLKPADVLRVKYTPEIKGAVLDAIYATDLYSFESCANWMGVKPVDLRNRLK